MTTRRLGPFPAADLLIAAAIAGLTFLFCYDAADWKRPELKTIARDVWFEADTDRERE